MGVAMSTLVGWAVIVGAASGFFYREWHKKEQQRLAKAQAQRIKQDRQAPVAKKDHKENKPKRQRVEDTQKDSYAAKLKSAPSPPSSQQAHQGSYSSDDDVDNREFARQLSNVKQGTKLATKAKDETKQKSVKQSKAKEVAEHVDVGKVSAPSSTAGIDGDDDQSSAASPLVSAVGVGGVEDMLEKPAPGPSVLRLTDVQEKKPKEKKAKAPEPAETKKQRQNRKKAEAAKAAREEAEKDRKIKLEAQRRAAREAEGRAAKDGSGFMAAQATGNVWKGNGVNGKAGGGSEAGASAFLPVQPLDTFESNAVQTDASRSSIPSADKNDGWMSSLPSEEEQMEMLRNEEADAWSTVKTKPRKSKKKEAAPVTDDEAAAPAPQAPAPVVSQSPNHAQKTTSSSRPTKIFNQQSSFAALSPETPPEQEEEMEWEV